MQKKRTRIDVAGLLVGMTLSLVACEATTPLLMPSGSQNIKPPAVYERWWAMTEQCSGLTGDFNYVLWYVVPNPESFSFRNLRNVQGIWMEDDRIILASDHVLDGHLVRHQMLHSLMKQGHHARADFVGKCGGTVACDDVCLADAGPPPFPDVQWLSVAPSTLEVTVSAFPESPGPDILSGYVELVVTARNPSDRAVTVKLPAPGDETFRYNFASNGSRFFFDDRTGSIEATRFEPGEVKRRVFDFWIAGTSEQLPMEPGEYRLQGAYADQWAPGASSVTLRR